MTNPDLFARAASLNYPRVDLEYMVVQGRLEWDLLCRGEGFGFYWERAAGFLERLEELK